MAHPPELYQWKDHIANPFPGLSQPGVMGLALWSLGMIVVRSCSLTAIADWWSCRLDQPFHTVRERLRDPYRDAEAKAGNPPRPTRREFVLGAGAGSWKAGPAGCGRWPWMRPAWATLRGAGDPRGLSRVCRTGRLEGAASGAKTSVETGVVGLAETVRKERTGDVDRARTRRSRLVRQVAVRGDSRARLAPDAAHPFGGQRPSRGLVSRGAFSPVGFRRGAPRAKPRNGVCRQKHAVGVPLAGLGGRRPSGRLVDLDRPAARSGRGLLVRAEIVD